jgi:hypothetical protein
MTYARSLLVAVAALLALVACNSDALPPAAQFTLLQGVVMDKATNQPIAGALVTIDAILTATTDVNGKFNIDKVPSGDFDYTIVAKGYGTISGSGRAEPGKPQILDLHLTSKGSPH